MSRRVVTRALHLVPPKGPGEVTGLVVMTPSGPATCATWIQWRAPEANPIDNVPVGELRAVPPRQGAYLQERREARSVA